MKWVSERGRGKIEKRRTREEGIDAADNSGCDGVVDNKGGLVDDKESMYANEFACLTNSVLP